MAYRLLISFSCLALIAFGAEVCDEGEVAGLQVKKLTKNIKEHRQLGNDDCPCESDKPCYEENAGDGEEQCTAVGRDNTCGDLPDCDSQAVDLVKTEGSGSKTAMAKDARQTGNKVWTVEGDAVYVKGESGKDYGGVLEFDVYANSATSVNLKCDVIAEDGGDNSFYVYFDNNSPAKWSIDSWTSTFAERTVPGSFSLSTGFHILKIGDREDMTKIKSCRISSGDAEFRSPGCYTPTAKSYVDASNIGGKVLGNLQFCKDACDDKTNCKGFDFQNEECYLKSATLSDKGVLNAGQWTHYEKC